MSGMTRLMIKTSVTITGGYIPVWKPVLHYFYVSLLCKPGARHHFIIKQTQAAELRVVSLN